MSMLPAITLDYQTHLIIYGTGSLVIMMTLIALLRNLFCRSSKDAYDVYSDKLSKSRGNSRSFVDYSRSKSNRSNYDYTSQNHKSSLDSIPSKQTETPVLSNTSTPNTRTPNTVSSKSTIRSPTPTTTPIQPSPTGTPTSPITMTAISPIPQFSPCDTHSYHLQEQGSCDTDVDGTTDPELERINSPKKRKSISISINIPNFKLPRMPSIASRSTSILKKVLRRMESGQYDSQDIHLVIRTTSIFGCIGFLLSLLMLTTYYLTREAYGYIYFTYGALVLYGVSKFIIYSLSLFRLYFALNNSVLQYSKYVYIALIALFILHLIVFIVACGLLHLQYFFLSIYCAVFFFALDIVFICILYVLFTKRMFELFENTSTYIAESKAKASAYDHRRDVFTLVQSPGTSACSTPRNNGTYAHKDRKASTNNLSIQIASNYKPRPPHCDTNMVYPMHPISSISPQSLKPKNNVRVKSYSADVTELTLANSNKDSMDRDCSFTNTNRSLSNIVEESHNNKPGEPSKTKRKREKWKHYQQQQASGIEYVTRYSVLVLLSSLSSLAMAGVLIYEERYNFDGIFSSGSGMDDAMELHIILCIDMIINCITIYFYFVFGRWLYQATCCLCHAFVQRCCVSLCI
eukprot:21954_1